MNNYSHPLVSIVLASYKGDAKFLGRSISSIKRLDMNPQDLELIVAFDGPIDQTSDNYLVDACAGAKFPVKVFSSKEPIGYYTVPRNRTMPDISGLYVAHMDADNEFAVNHLSGLLEAIRVPHETEGWPHFVYSRRQYIIDPPYKSDKIQEGPSPLTPWMPENIAKLHRGPLNNFIDTGDLLIGKAVLYELAERTGYVWNQDMRRFGDWDLVRRLASSGFRGRAVDQITNLYHITGENVSLTRSLSDLVAVPQSWYDDLKQRGQVIE